MKTLSLFVFTGWCLSGSIAVQAQHPEPGLVKDINPGADSGLSGNTSLLFAGDGKLYFQGNNGSNGTEPWISDGTAAGTVMLKNIYHYTAAGIPMEGSSYPSAFSPLGALVLFVAEYAQAGIPDRELFLTDGTTAGTSLLKNIRTTGLGHSSYPSQFCNIGPLTVFTATDGVYGTELWVTDGTASGTVLLKDCDEGSAAGAPVNLTFIDGKVYFNAYNDAGANCIWVTDGTPAGTQILKSQCSGFYFTKFAGKIFFSGKANLSDTTSRELWVTDGTEAGTVLFKDLLPGLAGSFPEDFVVMAGKMYFTANDGIHGRELWVSDGTVSGTYMLEDIYPGIENSEINNMQVYNGKLFFRAYSNATNCELWVTNGLPGGTFQYCDLNPGSAGGFPSWLTVYNNRLYFTGKSADDDYQYYYIEGSSTTPVKIKPAGADVNSGVGGISHKFVAMGGSFYFAASYNTSVGYELYQFTTTPYDESVSIQEHPANERSLQVYPNPAQDRLTIKVAKASTIEIWNSFGQLVMNLELNAGSKNIDIPSWPAGVYWARSLTGNETIKIVKQ